MSAGTVTDLALIVPLIADVRAKHLLNTSPKHLAGICASTIITLFSFVFDFFFFPAFLCVCEMLGASPHAAVGAVFRFYGFIYF